MWKGKLPKTKKQKEEAADASAYTNGGNHICIPSRQIKGCIKQAISLGKMKVERSMKRAIDLTQAALWVVPMDLLPFEPEIVLGDTILKEHDIMTEQGKIIEGMYRSVLPPWSLPFSLEVNLLEPDFIYDALVFGGLYCGIGGRRQDKNGRFEVVTFEIT
jgi:hypothetical protein